jgi:hypothetical protein
MRVVVNQHCQTPVRVLNLAGLVCCWGLLFWGLSGIILRPWEDVMRSSPVAISFLALLLVGGAAAAGWWLIADMAKDTPRPVISNVPLDPLPVMPVEAPAVDPEPLPEAPDAIDTQAPEQSKPAQAEVKQTTDRTRPQPVQRTESEDVAIERAADGTIVRAPADSSRRPPPERGDARSADSQAQADEDQARAKAEEEGRTADADAVERAMVEFAVTVAGRVKDESGYGIQGAEIRTSHVAVTQLDGGRHTGTRVELVRPEQPVAITDGGGNYEAELVLLVPEGTSYVDVTVMPSARGYMSGATVRAEGIRENVRVGNVDIALSAGGSVTGRVVDATLQPLKGVAVYATREAQGTGSVGVGGGLTSRAATDERGEYRFDGLAPGEWRITASSAAHAIDGELPKVSVSANVETRAPDLMMRPTATARIQVLKADGTPIGQGAERPVHVTIRLNLRDGSVASSSGVADDQGWVTYRRLPITAEEFTIRVQGYVESAPTVVNLSHTQENQLGTVRLTALDR